MKTKINFKLLGSLVIAFLCTISLSGQTNSENYIVNKTYKKARTTPVSGNNKDEVSTSIQYFDGLGRAKQTIALKAGGVLSNVNEVPIDWQLNNSATDFYNRNGNSAENKVVNGTTPFGSSDLLWECIPDASNNADGGWNTDYFEIDNTKTYRYTVWVKKNKVGGSAQGRTYHGIRNVNYLNGSPETWPYFLSQFLPQADTWYLMIGIIHPHNYTGGDTGVSGLYDKNGTKINNGIEYKWGPDINTTQLRSYLYYCTDTSVRQYFWSPLFEQVDGGNFTIDELVNSENTISGLAEPKDIVTHYEYDNFGRQTKEYLPLSAVTNGDIATGNIAQATNAYYQAKHSEDFAGVSLPDVNAYSEKVLESSPLSRVFEQTAPGNAWKKGSSFSSKGYSNNSHSIKFEYGVNTTNEVKSYKVSASFSNNTYTPTLNLAIVKDGFYEPGQLVKTSTKDENWRPNDGVNHTTEEFKNKEGQIVLKRTYNAGQKHDTYYVYDSFGNLTYVLPPKMEASTSSLATVVSKLNDLGYQYKYDHRNRLIEKKIPGKGWEYIVYDKLDRPILTQDALQRSKSTKEWLFTKYDILGRVVYTGLYKDNRSRQSIQSLANNNSRNYESFTGTTYIPGTLFYYTNDIFPSNIPYYDIYTINYYDSYVYWDIDTPAPSNNFYNTPITTKTKGLTTTSKVKILGVSNQWVTTITGYDKESRPIYLYSNNSFLGTTDIVENKLDDFTGKVLETKTTHKKTGKSDIITIDRFEYDHMDRLVSQTQKINNQIPERILKNNYDELGQLETKLVGNGTKNGYKDVTSGISISNDVITKTGANGWSHGLASQGSFAGDGYVEFSTNQLDKYYMVGLSKQNRDASYCSIDYAVYKSGNRIRVYESCGMKGDFGVFSSGDVFKIERIGSEIHYKKNGETFYISAKPSSGNLLGDISMHSNGGKIKDFKIVDNGKGLQKVDYAYNVRGWLKNINQDAHNDNDLFNFTINYNTPQNGVTPLFNGNVSETSWNTTSVNNTSNPVSNNYKYDYDALNRLTSAIDNTGNYNLENVTYDKMGNILRLKRNGHVNNGATSFGVMDDLSYSYDSGNKLLNVSDAGNRTYGFKDVSNRANEYSYDANGNMKTDVNKGITNIAYNHLNLPTQVTIASKNINYTYDASGVKLRKTVENTTTDYAGNYVYKDNTLKQITHPEGYLEPNGNSFQYVYRLKDIWNNTRVTYSDTDGDGVITPNTEIFRKQNYYPFGLEHEGYNSNVIGVKNNLKQYQSQEFTEDLGLNTHEWKYRVSDPAIGRFWQIDPLAEDYVYNSTYAFQENKMGMGVELEGREIREWWNNATEGLNRVFVEPVKNARRREAENRAVYGSPPRTQPGKNITGNYFGDALLHLSGGTTILDAFNGNQRAKDQLLLTAPLAFLPSGRSGFSGRISSKLNNKIDDFVSYYRVQGGGSFQRVSIDVDGNVSFRLKGSLNVSKGTMEHARYFQNLRGDESKIYSFEMPKWFDDIVDEFSVPQKGYKNNPLNQRRNAPKIVDPNQPGLSLEFPASWNEWFNENVKQGSGKIIN